MLLIMLKAMKASLAESGGQMPTEIHRDHLAYPYYTEDQVTRLHKCQQEKALASKCQPLAQQAQNMTQLQSQASHV